MNFEYGKAMRWVAVILLCWASCAAAAAADPGALFADGRLDEAEQALAKAPASPQTDLPRCRLALLNNQAAQALSCLAQLSDQTSKPVLGLRAEAERREDNFTAAAETYRRLGDQGHADEYAYLADHRPTGTNDGATHSVNFIRTDPLPILRATVGSAAPCDFLLDTGAGETVIDPKLAADEHAVLFGTDKGTFAGGKQAPIGHGVIGSLQIGDLTLRNLPVEVLDVSNFKSETGDPVCGVIGTGLLSRFVATIDYPKGRLLLEPAGTQHSGGQTVRIWLAGDHYVLAMGQINGGPRQLFLLDTGLAGGGFAAPDSTLAASGIAPAGTAITGQGGGGTIQAQPFVVNTLALGTAVQHQVAGFAGVFPPPLEHAFGTHIAGLISHQFFRSYALTFDFKNMVIRLVS
jgi:hypothetical protein